MVSLVKTAFVLLSNHAYTRRKGQPLGPDDFVQMDQICPLEDHDQEKRLLLAHARTAEETPERLALGSYARYGFNAASRLIQGYSEPHSHESTPAQAIGILRDVGLRLYGKATTQESRFFEDYPQERLRDIPRIIEAAIGIGLVPSRNLLVRAAPYIESTAGQALEAIQFIDAHTPVQARAGDTSGVAPVVLPVLIQHQRLADRHLERMQTWDKTSALIFNKLELPDNDTTADLIERVRLWPLAANHALQKSRYMKDHPDAEPKALTAALQAHPAYTRRTGGRPAQQAGFSPT